jgi:tRNA nucleotidyltransferase (CCA-adding enzyme)
MNEDVEKVLRAIRAAGGHPLLVGGWVRDFIIGVDSKDVDIEVYWLQVDDLERALSKVATVKEAGRSFGVFKIHSGDTDMDVSLPRKESKIGAGHRGFNVIVDTGIGQREASARRDFTLNSIMFDPETGTIIDLHGGLEDLQAGVLRHTSYAFGEDPLRVLRAVQFVARFGFRIHPQTIIVCQELKGEFDTLSTERIWGEFEKIGRRGKYISKAIDALLDTDWIGLWPELTLINGYDADRAVLSADFLRNKGEDRLVIVFAAMLQEAGADLARSFLESIGCPVGIIKRIIPLVRMINEFCGPVTAAATRKMARDLQPATIAEMYTTDPQRFWDWWVEAVAQDVATGPTPPILTGDMLIAFGLEPGPRFKAILWAALLAQDAGEFYDEIGAMNWLREYEGGR